MDIFIILYLLSLDFKSSTFDSDELYALNILEYIIAAAIQDEYLGFFGGVF